MSGKTKTDGVADADDITWTAVTGDPCEAVVYYKHTGSDATARLIAYIDAVNTGGLSVTPNGGNITLVHDSGANKIFKL